MSNAPVIRKDRRKTIWDLNARFPDCQPLLSLIGVEVARGESLPLQATCPMCHKDSFYIYANYRTAGFWHTCFSCGSYGDLLELVANICNMDIRDAGAILCGASEEESVKYINNSLIQQKTMEDFWQHSCKYSPYENTSLNYLYRSLGIRIPQSYHEWKERAGKYTRNTKLLIVEHVFRNFDKIRLPKKHIGIAKYLVGNWCEDVIMVPTYDLPNKLRAFYFIGTSRDTLPGEYKQTCVRVASRQLGKKNKIRDSGIMFLEASWTECTDFQDNLFLLLDPLLAIRLQHRHLLDNSFLLPVMGAYVGKPLRTPTGSYHNSKISYAPRDSWHSIPKHKKIIVWSPKKHQEEARTIAKLIPCQWSDIPPPKSLKWYQDWLYKLQGSAKSP